MNEARNTILFMNASKMNIPWNKLNRVESLCKENFKMLKKKLEEDTRRQKVLLHL